MLLQIHEPGSGPKKPHSPQIAIGIDLGTTHSLAAVIKDNTPVCITEMLPSVVAYGDHIIVVGQAALKALSTPNKTVISSVKRLMGKAHQDLHTASQLYSFDQHQDHRTIALNVGKGHVNPIQVSAEILQEIKRQSETYLHSPVTKAVITVPAYFDDAARQATKDAARLAGFEVLRLVNEPTAAALAYGLDTGAEGLYGIYDLGGGTFDFSVLRLQKGVFQVLVTAGDAQLGGDDFDHCLIELVENKTHTRFRHEDYQQALFEARRVKEALTTNDTVNFTFQVKCAISRVEFEHAITPLIQKTLRLCQSALHDKDLDPKELKGIVLVGGSTRVPAIAPKVEAFFDQAPLTNIDPDRTVAYGAALQAHALTYGSDTLLMDVTPLSLGLETMGGIVDRIIERNTAIPIAKAKDFTTYQDGQTGMVIHIVQGERELAQDCRSLARFELSGIPPMAAGAAKVKVTFQVDSDGLLTVSAQEETTGIHQQVEIKPSYGLDETQMRTMILQSLENAKHDVEARLLTEAKIEAKRLLEAVLSALTQDKNLLSEAEYTEILTQIDALEATLPGNDRLAINDAAKALEQSTQAFAERRMTRQIKLALEGKALNAIEQTVTKGTKPVN
jgi:molecular chaperone HscA